MATATVSALECWSIAGVGQTEALRRGRSGPTTTGRYPLSDHGWLNSERIDVLGNSRRRTKPKRTSAERPHHAYCRLPRLSDCLAFGTSTDGNHCGRHGVRSSCSTRWNAITPRRRGRGFSEYLGLASVLLASRIHFNGPNPPRPRA